MSTTTDSSGAAGNGDICAGHVHARADEVSAGNGVTQRHINQGAIGANVADGGETGEKSLARVGNRFEGALRRGFVQLR